jgi:bacterioferritin
MPNDFAIDVSRIRDEARQHLQQGPVTPSNTTDVDRVITVLNQVVASEMVCYLRSPQNAPTPSTQRPRTPTCRA